MNNIATYLPKSYVRNAREPFGEAFAEYKDALLRYCGFKIRNVALREDLVQETFLRAWKYISLGKTIENIRAFLYRVLGNLIIDEYRKGVREDSLDRLRDEGFDPGADYSDKWIDEIDGAEAVKMLTQVPDPYRKVLLLRYVRGLSIDEISAKIKESKNNVAVRAHRGLELLRVQYKNMHAM